MSWAMEHLRRPYPECAEMAALAKECNLNLTQTRYWFVNFRRRKLHDILTRQSKWCKKIKHTDCVYVQRSMGHEMSAEREAAYGMLQLSSRDMTGRSRFLRKPSTGGY